MHFAKASLLIVILVIPNTVWKDWQSSKNPALQSILQTASLGEMMPRTAEHDKITSDAEIRTFLAGARMTASGNPAELDYPVQAGNLADALVLKHCQIEIQTNPIKMAMTSPGDPNTTDFEMRMLDQPLEFNDAAEIIRRWRDRIQNASAGSKLILVSGCPSPEEYAAHERLCPIAVWQPNSKAGLLTSPSTRTLGLVTNTDIAPTIANLAGIDSLPGPVYGTTITTEPSAIGSAEDRLSYLASSAQKQETDQEYVPYFALGLAGLLLIYGLSFLKMTSLPINKLAIGILLSVPLALITAGEWRALLLIVALACSYTVISSKSNVTIQKIVTASLLILGIVCCDAIFNHSLFTARSLMGYSYQEGARYYGLGNEAMGAMIGAAVCCSTGLWIMNKKLRGLGGLVWLALGVIFALPSIGAKAGGVLVVGIAFAAYVILTRKSRLTNLAQIGIIAIGLAAAVAVLGISAHLGGESHVSQTLNESHKFGSSTIVSIITRKLAMDFKLMFHSTWMLVLLASLGAQILVRRKMAHLDKDGKGEIIWKLGLICTAACLLLNDAGVVAAALCSLPTLAMLSAISAQSAGDVHRSDPLSDTTPVQQST